MPPEATARFVLDSGAEVPAVSSEQMRELDRIAVHDTGPTLLQMMENAGRSLAAVTIARLGSAWRRGEIVVLAGGGGNGGGGICAARHLANHGGTVKLVVASPDALGEAAAFQRRIFAATAGGDTDLAGVDRLRPTVVLDALTGYGLREAPRGALAGAIGWADQARERGASLIALDIPSGVDATTGRKPGVAISADITVTLALPKTGLRAEQAGEIILADLGIPERIVRRIVAAYISPFDGRWYRELRVLHSGR